MARQILSPPQPGGNADAIGDPARSFTGRGSDLLRGRLCQAGTDSAVSHSRSCNHRGRESDGLRDHCLERAGRLSRVGDDRPR